VFHIPVETGYFDVNDHITLTGMAFENTLRIPVGYQLLLMSVQTVDFLSSNSSDVTVQSSTVTGSFAVDLSLMVCETHTYHVKFRQTVFSDAVLSFAGNAACVLTGKVRFHDVTGDRLSINADSNVDIAVDDVVLDSIILRGGGVIRLYTPPNVTSGSVGVVDITSYANSANAYFVACQIMKDASVVDSVRYGKVFVLNRGSRICDNRQMQNMVAEIDMGLGTDYDTVFGNGQDNAIIDMQHNISFLGFMVMFFVFIAMVSIALLFTIFR
jgi:hypothetical protein